LAELGEKLPGSVFFSLAGETVRPVHGEISFHSLFPFSIPIPFSFRFGLSSSLFRNDVEN